MRFKFVGNPHAIDNRGDIVVFGIRFPLNVEVDVTNPHAIKKLMGNHHFAAVDGGKTYHQAPRLIVPQPILGPDGAAMPPAADAQQSAADQPDHDEKAQLIAFAEEHGVKVDKRWNVAKITAAIDAAAAEAALQQEGE